MTVPGSLFQNHGRDSAHSDWPPLFNEIKFCASTGPASAMGLGWNGRARAKSNSHVIECEKGDNLSRRTLANFECLTGTRICESRSRDVLEIRSNDKESLMEEARAIIENWPACTPSNAALTHFLSIPLNLRGELSSQFEYFQSECIEQWNLPPQVFIVPEKLHLTIAMMAIDSNAAMSQVKRVLNGIDWSFLSSTSDDMTVDVAGVAVMKGSDSKCRVLHANVHHSTPLLDTIADQLFLELGQHGLLHDLEVKWHVTLMNSQFVSRSSRNRQRLDWFDARPILDTFDNFDFGSTELSCIHLSSLKKPPHRPTGYYHCDHRINLF